MTLMLALIALAGDWAQLSEDALGALKQGKFHDAERLALSAIAASPGDHERALAHMNLGRVYRDWARCEPAVHHTERSLQLLAKERDALVTMEAASQLVSTFLECGALDRARAIEKRYIDFTRARQQLAPVRLAQLIGNAGAVALMRERYAEAEPLLREAIALARPVDQAVLYGSLSLVMMGRKQPAAALVEARRGLALVESELGLGHPLAVRMLANLSAICARLGDEAQAAAHHQRAITLLERYYGHQHPLLADVLLNRAKALRDARRKPEARTLEQRAKAIQALAPPNQLDHAVGFAELEARR